MKVISDSTQRQLSESSPTPRGLHPFLVVLTILLKGKRDQAGFGGMKWDSWPDDVKKKWDIPMNLGEPARKAIRGNT